MMEKICKNCRHWKEGSSYGGMCRVLDRLWTLGEFGCLAFEEREYKPPYKPFRVCARVDEPSDGWRIVCRFLNGREELASMMVMPLYVAQSWVDWLNNIWQKERDNDGEDL